MSDGKEKKKESTPDFKEPGRDKKKSESETDTTESDFDTTTSEDDKQKKTDRKPQQPEQSKQDLQKLTAGSSKPQLSKPELPKVEAPKVEPPKVEPPKIELPKLPDVQFPQSAFHPLNPPTPESPAPAQKKISRLGSVLLKRPKEQPPPGGPGGPGEPHVNKKWWQSCYDKENKMYCGRTCQSWMYIVVYSIMYLIFLSTYTMIVLYVSLVIIKANDVYLEKTEDFQFLKNGIGLTVTPTSEDSYPMIWYHKSHPVEYQKYVNALERLVNQRRKDASDHKYLGPCGVVPFGYEDAPCVIVRINKNWGWKAKPLQLGFASNVPSSVHRWAQKDAKLWLNCGGQNPYDAEHIGSIKYFPDPPGFDSAVFPLGRDKESPLIGVQFPNVTLGVSIVVECKLWYEDGTSAVDFVLYVGT